MRHFPLVLGSVIACVACGTTDGADKQAVSFDTLCWQITTLARLQDEVDPVNFHGMDCGNKLVPMNPAEYFGKMVVQCDSATKSVRAVTTVLNKCRPTGPVNEVTEQIWRVVDGKATVVKEVNAGEDREKNEVMVFSGDGVQSFKTVTPTSTQVLHDLDTVEKAAIPMVESGFLTCQGGMDLLRSKAAVKILSGRITGSGGSEFKRQPNGKYHFETSGETKMDMSLEDGSSINCIMASFPIGNIP